MIEISYDLDISRTIIGRTKKKIESIYILLGNDSYLLQDSYLSIIKMAKLFSFNEHVAIDLDAYSDWRDVFNLFKVSNLFEKRKILSLKFSQNYPVTYFKKNAPLLYSFLRNDLILILYINESNQINKNNICLQLCNHNGVFVDCTKLPHDRLRTWIENKAKNMNLVIEDLAYQLLCYYYEGNLILLNQILQNLFLIYPDGHLSFVRVRKIVTDSAYFNVNHWVEAILIGNKKRADRILRKLEHMGVNLEILLRKIKCKVLMIINIKHEMEQQKTLFSLLKQYKVYKKYNFILLSRAIKRLNLYQLYQAIELLAQMELRYKKDYTYLSRLNFELLSMILCYNQNVVFDI